MKPMKYLLLLLLLCLPMIGSAAEEPTAPEETEVTETEPQLPRYQVAIATSGGGFEGVADFETFADAQAAYATQQSAAAVVIDRERTNGNGVILAKDAIVVTAPTKVAGVSTFNYGKPNYQSYVGAGYDAQLLSNDGTNVSIALMGMSGAISPTKDAQAIDLVEIIPQAHSPAMSYYEVRDGRLRHVLQTYSYDDATNRYVASATAIFLGTPPAFMEPEKPYYSYDANTMYTDRALTNVAGTHQPYFKTLPIRSRSIATAEQLDAYIQSWTVENSVMMGIGRELKRIEDKWGVNAEILLSLAAHESGKGTSAIARDKNNLFGIRATDGNPYGNAEGFHSISDNLEYMAQLMLHEGYLDPGSWRYHGGHVGDKASGMNIKYASDPYWGEKVTGHMVALYNFLGLTHEQYEIAMVKTGTPVYATAELAGAPMYTLKNASVPENHAIYVLLTEKTNKGFAIQGVIDTSEEEGYSFRSTGYIAADAVIDNTEINPQALTETKMTRLQGANRYETALAISQRAYHNAETVVVANGHKAVDALSAAPLASVWQAPVLTINGTTMTEGFANELQRLQTKRVVLIGGTSSISQGIEDALKARGLTVERISGANRYATNDALNARLMKETQAPTQAFIASGVNVMDALAIGGYAAQQQQPIVLTDGRGLTKDAMALVKSAQTLYALGGEMSTPQAVLDTIGKPAKRIAGSDRYATAFAIAREFYKTPKSLVFATGKTEADALTGVSVTRLNEAPLLLLSNNVTEAMKAYIQKSQANHVFILGGSLSVPDQHVNDILSQLQ